VIEHSAANTRNNQIMNDIESEAGARHVAGESVGTVEAGVEPAHHCEAHQPAVEAVERTAEVFRCGVVLAPSGDDERDAGDNCGGHQRNPCLAHRLLHFVARKDEIAHQEGNQVEERLVEIVEAVGGFGTRVHDEGLLAEPEEDTEEKNPNNG